MAKMKEFYTKEVAVIFTTPKIARKDTTILQHACSEYAKRCFILAKHTKILDF